MTGSILPVTPTVEPQPNAGDPAMETGVLYNAVPRDGKHGTYAERMQRFFAALGYSRAEVDDLTQETFLEVHRRGGYKPGAMSAKTWLFLVARQVRKRWREVAVRDIKIHGALTLLREEEMSPAFADDADLRRIFEIVLSRLDEHERELFVLHFYEQNSRDEIAKVFEVPLGTVDSRTARLRGKVKALLGAGKGHHQ